MLRICQIQSLKCEALRGGGPDLHQLESALPFQDVFKVTGQVGGVLKWKIWLLLLQHMLRLKRKNRRGDNYFKRVLTGSVNTIINGRLRLTFKSGQNLILLS